VWHKTCFKCQTCGMTLNMKTYKGFNKLPYCEAHIPKVKATTVSETPESRRLAENTKLQSQVKYHEDFEKAKGKFTQVADDPETLRIKANTKIISNVAYHGELEKKALMEQKRNLTGADDTGMRLLLRYRYRDLSKIGKKANVAAELPKIDQKWSSDSDVLDVDHFDLGEGFNEFDHSTYERKEIGKEIQRNDKVYCPSMKEKLDKFTKGQSLVGLSVARSGKCWQKANLADSLDSIANVSASKKISKEETLVEREIRIVRERRYKKEARLNLKSENGDADPGFHDRLLKYEQAMKNQNNLKAVYGCRRYKELFGKKSNYYDPLGKKGNEICWQTTGKRFKNQTHGQRSERPSNRHIIDVSKCGVSETRSRTNDGIFTNANYCQKSSPCLVVKKEKKINGNGASNWDSRSLPLPSGNNTFECMNDFFGDNLRTGYMEPATESSCSSKVGVPLQENSLVQKNLPSFKCNGQEPCIKDASFEVDAESENERCSSRLNTVFGKYLKTAKMQINPSLKSAAKTLPKSKGNWTLFDNGGKEYDSDCMTYYLSECENDRFSSSLDCFNENNNAAHVFNETGVPTQDDNSECHSVSDERSLRLGYFNEIGAIFERHSNTVDTKIKSISTSAAITSSLRKGKTASISDSNQRSTAKSDVKGILVKDESSEYDLESFGYFVGADEYNEQSLKPSRSGENNITSERSSKASIKQIDLIPVSVAGKLETILTDSKYTQQIDDLFLDSYANRKSLIYDHEKKAIRKPKYFYETVFETLKNYPELATALEVDYVSGVFDWESFFRLPFEGRILFKGMMTRLEPIPIKEEKEDGRNLVRSKSSDSIFQEQHFKVSHQHKTTWFSENDLSLYNFKDNLYKEFLMYKRRMEDDFKRALGRNQYFSYIDFETDNFNGRHICQ
ncbi:hypothetical protein QYM36_006053, partial [Artemia franciscana]